MEQNVSRPTVEFNPFKFVGPGSDNFKWVKILIKNWTLGSARVVVISRLQMKNKMTYFFLAS